VTSGGEVLANADGPEVGAIALGAPVGRVALRAQADDVVLAELLDLGQVAEAHREQAHPLRRRGVETHAGDADGLTVLHRDRRVGLDQDEELHLLPVTDSRGHKGDATPRVGRF
jgi:hypothetical protein